MDSSSNHHRSMEVLDLQVYDEDFECSICDFKCSSGPDMVQHSEAHRDIKVTYDDLNSSNTSNILKDFENGKDLVLDMTSTIFGIDGPDNSEHPVKEEPSLGEDDSDTENFYESITNENADMVLSKETQMYNEIKNKIFDEDNYSNCSFKYCDLIIYVEHLEKHLRDHQSGYVVTSCNNDKSSTFMCTECGQKYGHFSQISNHIFIHFKEKTPNQRVCTVCGYRSKRLSSFKIHKCNNLKLVDTNIPEAIQHKYKSVTNNEQITKDHKKNHKMAADQEYNPSENSDNSGISDISDCSDESNDSDYQLPKSKTYTNYIKKKRKNINESKSDDKEESISERKYLYDFYSDRIAKMKVSCKICNKKFDNETLCKAHFNSDQNNCEKEVKISNLWRKEINKETRISFYVCLKCNKSFYNESACEKHIAVQHKNMKYYCDQCEHVTCRRLIAKHIKLAHASEQPICAICNKTYKNKNTLKDHMRYTHSSSPLQEKERSSLCNLCGKVFPKRKLPTHMLIHTGKKHACNLCEFSTVQKYNLVVHMRSHENKGSVIYKRTKKKSKDETNS